MDFIFADAMKQEGWVVEATVLFVHTNFSAENLRELRRKAGGMKVTKGTREKNRFFFREQQGNVACHWTGLV